ncbi:MAG: hypothetical protein ABIB11_00060 [Candidatus Omnitrophota bacterium]
MKRYKQYQILFVLFLLIIPSSPAFSESEDNCPSGKSLYPIDYAVERVADLAQDRELEADQKIKDEDQRINAEIENTRQLALEEVKKAEAEVERAKYSAAEIKEELQKKLDDAQMQLQSARDKVEEANESVLKKVRQVKNRYSEVDDLFRKGKKSYYNEDYNDAITAFEDLLTIDPQFEPAKLYLQNCVMKMQVINEAETIHQIKISMADIIAEFETRRQCVKGLTARYFLEQAQRKCQLGEYGEAEKLFGICYKINPSNKKQVEWFVNATYELMELSKQLDEHIQRVDELAATEN